MVFIVLEWSLGGLEMDDLYGRLTGCSEEN